MGLFFWGGKQMEQERLAAETRLSKLARQVAHDIRSPLTALRVAENDLQPLPEETRQLVRMAIQRISDIAQTLSARGRQGQQPQAHSLAGLLVPLVTEKRAQFANRPEAEIHLDIATPAWTAFAAVDPSEFQRALSNLINNAVEAIEGPGRVTVELSATPQAALIRITDTGQGIPADLIARLGTPGLTFGKTGGSGLGLSHARKAIESWNGKLDIQSVPGLTTLALRIPVMQSPWQLPRSFTSAICLRGIAILVVTDDDPGVHAIWNKRLGAFPALHFFAPNDLDAWHHENPRLAATALFLVDHKFAGSPMNGIELIEKLGITQRSILITGRYDDPAIIGACERLGLRLLPKPLVPHIPIDRT